MTGSILRVSVPPTVTHTASSAIAALVPASTVKVTAPDASSTLTSWSTGGSTWIQTPPKPRTALHDGAPRSTDGGAGEGAAVDGGEVEAVAVARTGSVVVARSDGDVSSSAPPHAVAPPSSAAAHAALATSLFILAVLSLSLHVEVCGMAPPKNRVRTTRLRCRPGVMTTRRQRAVEAPGVRSARAASRALRRASSMNAESPAGSMAASRATSSRVPPAASIAKARR